MQTARILLLAVAACLAPAQVQTVTCFQLPGVPEDQDAAACSINESGAVAAKTAILGNPVRSKPSILAPNGGFELLEDLPGCLGSRAVSINSRCDVLGRATGLGQDNQTMMIWKDGVPMEVLLPPPPDPANRWWPNPADLDDAGRVLVRLTQFSPANQFVSEPLESLLERGKLTPLPPLPEGGAIGRVFNSFYLAMNPDREILGSATVIMNGSQVNIPFLYQDGAFILAPVANVFRVIGFSRQGSVFSQLFDNRCFVWKNGQTRLLPPFLAGKVLLDIRGWNAKGQTCASVRVNRTIPGAWRKNAVITFGAPGRPGKP